MPEAKLDFCMEFEAEENLSKPPTPEKVVEEKPKKKGFLKNPFKYTSRNTLPIKKDTTIEISKAESEASK